MGRWNIDFKSIDYNHHRSACHHHHQTRKKRRNQRSGLSLYHLRWLGRTSLCQMWSNTGPCRLRKNACGRFCHPCSAVPFFLIVKRKTFLDFFAHQSIHVFPQVHIREDASVRLRNQREERCHGRYVLVGPGVSGISAFNFPSTHTLSHAYLCTQTTNCTLTALHVSINSLMLSLTGSQSDQDSVRRRHLLSSRSWKKRMSIP